MNFVGLAWRLALTVVLMVVGEGTVVAAVPVDPGFRAAQPGLRGEAGAGPSRVAGNYGSLPLAFEANRGQTDPAVEYLARGPGFGLFLTPTEAVLRLRPGKAGSAPDRERGRSPAHPLGAATTLPDTVVRMRLAGANPRPQLTGTDRLPGSSNYLVGADPARWQRDVPNYARVKYTAVYPGIDLVYYGNGRQLEYDFIVAPGANPARIALDFKGARKLAIDAGGNLVLTTDSGKLVQHKPVVYQEIDGVRRVIDGRYVLRGKTRVGFRVARYDPARPLVIDPVLAYATFLGGAGNDFLSAVAVDGAGNAYVAGQAESGFPTSAGSVQPGAGGGGGDAYVAKLNATGTALVYSTFIGGG